MANLFFLSGSTSDDFEQLESVDNPLPPCPDSPNCVRISRKVRENADRVFLKARNVIKEMGAVEISDSKELHNIDAVFKVFLFKDDLSIRIEKVPEAASASYLHLRSSSREGYSDLGVNRRRVRRFLDNMDLGR